VAALFAGLSEASGFVLAGGAALIARGEIDRLTRDLDFFATDAAQVDQVVPIFEATVRNAGLTVSEVQVAAGFARLVVTDGDDRTGVDIAADARLLPADRTALGLLLSVEELAVDKVLAVFGRAEARDFVDLAALEPRFGLEHLCELAVVKDGGFDRQVFFEMLGRFGRLPRDEFDVDEDTFQSTAESVRRWRQALQGGPPPGS
jgi:predicted nucleotidyltransferase component of viral defense system